MWYAYSSDDECNISNAIINISYMYMPVRLRAALPEWTHSKGLYFEPRAGGK